jgi:hypothetical protein
MGERAMNDPGVSATTPKPAGVVMMLAIAVAAFGTAPAQAAGDAPKGWKVPRTADGHPDLQGNWTNATITPLERPAKYGDKAVLTDEEAQGLEHEEAAANAAGDEPTDPKKTIKDLPVNCGKGFSGVDCGYNSFWVDAGTQVAVVNGEKRSSLITSTANGRVPPLTPERQKAMGEFIRNLRGNFDGPEVRPLGERCLLSFGSSSGPPMLPSLYNNNYQIVQGKDSIVILVEMVHDARIVRMGGEHLPSSMRKWMGDSVGHWEGDTLVVETTNFTNREFFRGATENLKVTERFTRVGPGTINYKFTIDDPMAFTTGWGGELPMHMQREPVYEYACHEGNYALPGILAGAREEERAKAAAAK